VVAAARAARPAHQLVLRLVLARLSVRGAAHRHFVYGQCFSANRCSLVRHPLFGGYFHGDRFTVSTLHLLNESANFKEC
jgi:hypothetical protein